ncbi:family 1 glycosyltransferase [Ilyonectria destructans]|nr:family 1 glycosyltransferase [Ilyonectria destructans]
MTDQKSPRSKKILLLTNVERGEANVFLSTAHALIEADPNVELHFATFSGLDADVTSVWEEARRKVPQAKPIVYHELTGVSMGTGVMQYFMRKNPGQKEITLPESFMAKPGFSTTLQAIKDTIPIFIPYEGPQLVEIVASIMEVIKKVDADLVVINSLMTPGLTACYHMGVKFSCLSPNAIKEFAGPFQPRLANLWKYPALFSRFSYPIPWYLKPINVLYILFAVYSFEKDPHRREVQEYLSSQAGMTLRTPVDLLRDRPDGLKILVSTLPELDFPVYVPPHVIPCGPILRIAPPISETDPTLESWLANGPTVYFNLGSLCSIAEDQAVEIALALKSVLDTVNQQSGDSHLQVLWKLKKHGEYEVYEEGCKIQEILGKELQADIVRIVDWVLAEPISVLTSGHIACSVHHGGANSYNESVVAGVPQVVLPLWTDCYEYAQRVEMHGIGRWGTRVSKPKWTAEELTRELLVVLHGERSDAMKVKARELAAICKINGNGAVVAARMLLEECEK